MNEAGKKIGVLDSGVGGLTVVKELEALLPNEDIIYYGDNKNCPYGNRTAENIVELAHKSIGFLRSCGVKAVVVACNTTSSLIERFEGEYPFPIISIIKPACLSVASLHLPAVGVIATELTIKTGAYTRIINENDPNIVVYGEASHNLAALVDSGEFDIPAITDEVKLHLDALLAKYPLTHIIHGCTHYPIVNEVFKQLAPDISFINPAKEQAAQAARALAVRGLLNTKQGHSLNIYTSGSQAVYGAVLKRLCIQTPAIFHKD
ncbi:MAG: glutamate racemase [Hydrogenoanaerobacterium sp.]